MNQILEQDIFVLEEEQKHEKSSYVEKMYNTNLFFKKRLIEDFSRYILFPLIKKANLQKEMNAVVILIKFIKEKYKDDPEQMNSALGYLLDFVTYPNSILISEWFKDHKFTNKEISNIRRLNDSSFNMLANELYYSGLVPLHNIVVIRLCILCFWFFLYKQVPKVIDISHVLAYEIYKFLYIESKLNPPDIPVLNKVNNQIKEQNIELLKKDFGKKIAFSESFLKNDIVNNYLIGKEIGSGAYGQVYSFHNLNWVLKITENGYDLKNDLQRFNTIENQLYSGKASLEDMHYFDHGEVGKKNAFDVIYYIVMPKIIPLVSTKEYKQNIGSYKTLEKEINKHSSWSHKSINEPKKFFKDVMDSLKKNNRRIFDEISEQKIVAYLKAFVRAKTLYKGSDLHTGNIGFFEQKPEILFFYDM